jgi:hypothetical protein
MSRQRGRLCLLLFLLVFSILHQVPVLGQTISGIIAGTIVDPSGAVLPAVSITVENPETGRAYVASTNDQGYYRIPEVPPGLYEVTAELGGFQSEKHIGVRVSVNRTTLEDCKPISRAARPEPSDSNP